MSDTGQKLNLQYTSKTGVSGDYEYEMSRREIQELVVKSMDASLISDITKIDGVKLYDNNGIWLVGVLTMKSLNDGKPIKIVAEWGEDEQGQYPLNSAIFNADDKHIPADPLMEDLLNQRLYQIATKDKKLPKGWGKILP